MTDTDAPTTEEVHAFSAHKTIQPGSLLRSMLHKPAPYFHPEGANAFKEEATRESDVVHCSFAKCGTSWMHSILMFLLHADPDGALPEGYLDMVGGANQVYPDALSMVFDPNDTSRPAALVKEIAPIGYEGLAAQPDRRLFTCHIRPGNLPAKLRETGRVVLTTRNPKDALISMYYFCKKLCDLGMLPPPVIKAVENDTLEDYFEGFVDESDEGGPETMGTYFRYYNEMMQLVDQMGDRAGVFCYEKLQADFESEIRRLANFLDVELSDEKLEALRKYTCFDSMSGRGQLTCRKGVVGNYQEHLSEEHWQRMGKIFNDRLGHHPSLAHLAGF